MMKVWRTITLLYKNISFFISLVGIEPVDIKVWETVWCRLMEDLGLRGLLYWPFLLSHLVLSYSRPHLALLLLFSRWGNTMPPLSTHWLLSMTDHIRQTLWLTDCETDRSDVGTLVYIISYHLCILPVQDSWDLLTPLYCLFSCNQFVYTWASCVEKSFIDRSVKGQYVTMRQTCGGKKTINLFLVLSCSSAQYLSTFPVSEKKFA